jgi:hypothetical protein
MPDAEVRASAVRDLENQRVVRADAERTRVAATDDVETLLTLYCQRNGLRYKQGLNEVITTSNSIYMLGVGALDASAGAMRLKTGL